MEGTCNLVDKIEIDAIITVGDDTMVIALRRLAILETHPIRSLPELQEWRLLRKWVLDNNLVGQYQDQRYFQESREVTKKQYAPKNPNSFPKRIWNYISSLL